MQHGNAYQFQALPIQPKIDHTTLIKPMGQIYGTYIYQRPLTPTNLQKKNNKIDERSATIYANSEELLRQKPITTFQC